MQFSGYPTMPGIVHPVSRSSLPDHEPRRYPEALVHPKCVVLLRYNASDAE
jgi:hypothetical protein